MRNTLRNGVLIVGGIAATAMLAQPAPAAPAPGAGGNGVPHLTYMGAASAPLNAIPNAEESAVEDHFFNRGEQLTTATHLGPDATLPVDIRGNHAIAVKVLEPGQTVQDVINDLSAGNGLLSSRVRAGYFRTVGTFPDRALGDPNLAYRRATIPVRGGERLLLLCDRAGHTLTYNMIMTVNDTGPEATASPHVH